MNKQQLIDLEENAHLSIAQLRKVQPALAESVGELLEERIRHRSVESLAGISDKLRKAAEKVKLPLGVAPDTALLRESTLKAFREAVVKDPKLAQDAELKKELDELERASERPSVSETIPDASLADSMRIDEPVAFNPGLRRELDAARLYRLSDACSLGDGIAAVLIEHVGSVTGITADGLKTLVSEKKLDEKKAKAAGLAGSLYQVLDERLELVKSAMKGIEEARDLVKKERADWIKIIRNSKTKPPGGISPEEYADLLKRKIARLFPTDTLADSLSRLKVGNFMKEHAQLAELRRLNPGAPLLVDRDFDSLKKDGIAPAEVKKLKSVYSVVVRFVNRYIGMGLSSVLDDASLSDIDKESEVTRRTALANSFFADNADVLSMDLTHNSDEVKKLSFTDRASESDREMVLANARAYQRVTSVTGDITDAEALIAGGFPSALSLATSRIESLEVRTGLNGDDLTRYRETAKKIASRVAAHVGTVIDVMQGGFREIAVGNVSPALSGYLKEIPGFADFFGNQDYCNCRHCQSILSPAAYFVDLMCFVEDNVTHPFFTSKPDHPLNLKTRRPDLWNLELTCGNTNEPIPYLSIINGILENAVAKDAGFIGDFGDRKAVKAKVYEETLPDAVNSFIQPLNLPFEEFRTYLRHFNRTPADVGEVGNATGDSLARLRLSLPPRDYELITQVNDSIAFLRKVYGINFRESGGSIRKFDAQLLLGPMGVSREELGELVSTRFVTADGTVNIRIKGEKRSEESVQNDIEFILELTRAALDRMHRFVRLWHATGWRIGELDLVLTHLKQEDVGFEMDAAAVCTVAHVRRLQIKQDLDVEESTALWSVLPQHAILNSAPALGFTQEDGSTAYPKTQSPLARFTISLFDRLFNGKRFVDEGGSLPQPNTAFLHPALAGTVPADIDPNLHRLQAATGTDDDELLQLILGLARPLGVNPSSEDDDKKKFSLTLRNLSLLYRHARLARLLRIEIPELFALCGLAPEIRSTYIEDLSDLDALFGIHTWWKTTDLKLSQLVRIVRPGFPATLTSKTPLDRTSGDETVTYTPTVFGEALPAETVNFGVNANIQSAVEDWNGKTRHAVAFRSDATGFETPEGAYFSIRGTAGTGPDSKLEVTTDSASIFSAIMPMTGSGDLIVPGITGEESFDLEASAKEIVEQVSEAKTLVFADTVFAQLRPSAPVATSSAPLASTVGGETVDYELLVHGASEADETIAFAANPTLEAAVADWNAKAVSTRAFLSDAAGQESASGTHLSITPKNGTGSRTRLTITSDPDGIFTNAVPKELRGAEITESQSRSIVSANPALIDPVDADGHYCLKAGFDPDAALVLPAGVDPLLMLPLRNILLEYHGKTVLSALLPARAGVSPETSRELISMIGADLDGDIYFRELRGDVSPPSCIAGIIGKLRRLEALFTQETVFDPENLNFIRKNARLFGIEDFSLIGMNGVRRVELYRSLSEGWVARNEPCPDLRGVLLVYTAADGFGAADKEELAALLGSDVGRIQSLCTHLSLSATPFEALQELIAAVELSKTIGIGGDAIKLAQSVRYADLATSSSALQAAIRAKYEDEAEWENQVGPFDDALLSRRRDGLVAYLVHSGAPQFDEVADLYHYYLLDFEVDGCMRTSPVAAAIDSVQLYVHRCLSNLEETPPGDSNPIHVLPESIPDEEWSWRKNYRVWEANRKIFLYPENYLEPELRDDKTPLFKTLEEELLSKELTDEALLEAYGRYLRGFDELAHLTIAGSYHEKDEESRRDVLHLIGVTSDDPPIFYYRRVEDAHFGPVSDDRATRWGAWEKLNIQVPVRKVSPVTYNGQLYLFWNRYTTKPVHKVVDGTSKFDGYQHRALVEFSARRVDGSWTTPQPIRLDTDPFNAAVFPKWYEKEGLINDLIVTKSTTILGFWVTGSILGLWNVTFWADADGNATIDFLGMNFKIQLPANVLASGGSFQMEGQTFVATPIYFPNLRAPLYDSKAHPEPHDGYTLEGCAWDRIYPCGGSVLSLRGFNFQMWSPIDLYKLKIGARYEYDNAEVMGVPWFNPLTIDVLIAIVFILSCGRVDLSKVFPKYNYIWSRSTGDRRVLYKSKHGRPCFDDYSFASLLLDEARFKKYKLPLKYPEGPQWDSAVTDHFENLLSEEKIADIPGDFILETVNGSTRDVTLQNSRDAFYLQGGIRADGKYHLRRLNTSTSEDIASILFNKGLDHLLSTRTQEEELAEYPTALNLEDEKVWYEDDIGSINFRGAMGTYLREIFFHIPFLIANTLNSQGRFGEAQRWYHYIFDPTSSETIQDLPADLTPEERRRRELDRNWRYREFRVLDPDSLRDQLTDEAAISQYELDPFNPHAIARLRISAYQKAIIMKYVDNMLDWGDDLFIKAFSQQNPEYLREATLKYVTAGEILGDRPARLGECGEGKLTPKNFPKIREALLEGTEFLMEMESLTAVRYRLQSPRNFTNRLVAIDAERGAWATAQAYARHEASRSSAGEIAAVDPVRTTPAILRSLSAASKTLKVGPTVAAIADNMLQVSASSSKPVTAGTAYDSILNVHDKWLPGWGISFVREVSPIFCIPGNERMLQHWDRVEDRLYKLRHCQDIEGVFRLLPLFAPEIEPGLLVGGKASGLSLEDILAASSGNLPPYRFRYLLDKAKGSAAAVQSFGAALLSALEKRDAEELTRLRNIHQKNLLSLTTEVRRNELKIAEESCEIVTRRMKAAEYRKEYYGDLISQGLTLSEKVETNARRLTVLADAVVLGLDLAAAIMGILPRVGSPFAMVYGGEEVHRGLSTAAQATTVIGKVAEMTAIIAGIEAGHERREQGWKHQKKLAEHDIMVIEKELVAANLRKAIAARSLELHEKMKEQHAEIMDFFADKFSNLGLYTHLSRTLQQLHREAYNNALALARLAEQAYRFERAGDNTIFVGGEWDASRSGLLAGERLLMALNKMDRRYIETNTRQAEINQTFSLTQIAPQSILDLKETGRCEFTIPEFYFDIFYPGQYRRRVRAVRLTIPCITGPYTNISAKLTLLRSYIRKEASPEAAYLLELPSSGTTAISTSTGQGDAGVFELSFRDEKYMPFEGAGAVSEWRLELPSNFRPFDYHTINDVFLNISYTAEEDEALRQQIENGNAALEGTLLHYLRNNTLTRVFSLRQEFSNTYSRLAEAAAGTPATIDIDDRHFPLFLQGRNLTIAKATVVLAVADRAPVGDFSMKINGRELTGFPDPTDPPAPGDAYGGLPALPAGSAISGDIKKQHQITIEAAGNLSAAPETGALLSQDKIRDILIILEYGL